MRFLVAVCLSAAVLAPAGLAAKDNKKNVHRLTKKAAASTNWAAGGKVYYTTTGGANVLTGVAATGKLIGYGTVTTVTGATSGIVRLRPVTVI